MHALALRYLLLDLLLSLVYGVEQAAKHQCIDRQDRVQPARTWVTHTYPQRSAALKGLGYP